MIYHIDTEQRQIKCGTDTEELYTNTVKYNSYMNTKRTKTHCSETLMSYLYLCNEKYLVQFSRADATRLGQTRVCFCSIHCLLISDHRTIVNMAVLSDAVCFVPITNRDHVQLSGLI